MARTKAAKAANSYEGRILRVLVHIQERLDDAVSIDSLARIAHFSPFHFHRVFSGMVGESVMAYVRRLRLERAAHELKHGTKRVIEIALDAGYDTQESFTRAFKDAFGQPPGRFRRAKSPAISLAAPSRSHFEPRISGPAGRRNPRADPCFQPLKGGIEHMEVKIVRQEPIDAVFLRHVGPYQEVGHVWEDLTDFAGTEDLAGPESLFFGLSHDDPDVTPPDRLRYDACVSVREPVEVAPPFGTIRLLAGEYASAIHTGPYEKLGETYAALFGRWLPESGRTPRSAPCVEIYLDDPRVTQPEERRTEVRVPLGPRRDRP